MCTTKKQKVHDMTKRVSTPEQKARSKELARERRANLTPEQKARRAELARNQWAKRTPEQAAVCKAKRSAYYTDNKDKAKAYSAANGNRQVELTHLRLYGVGLQETIDKFGTICNCCGTACKSTQPLHTDHCHETGVIRGRICGERNRAIGLCGDTVEGLEQAIKYLRGNHG